MWCVDEVEIEVVNENIDPTNCKGCFAASAMTLLSRVRYSGSCCRSRQPQGPGFPLLVL